MESWEEEQEVQSECHAYMAETVSDSTVSSAPSILLSADGRWSRNRRWMSKFTFGDTPARAFPNPPGLKGSTGYTSFSYLPASSFLPSPATRLYLQVEILDRTMMDKLCFSLSTWTGSLSSWHWPNLSCWLKVITMKWSPYSSPLNWMEQEGKFSQSFDVGNLMNQILTRLGAELSWIPEGNKKDFIQWKSTYALERILQLCSSSYFL